MSPRLRALLACAGIAAAALVSGPWAVGGLTLAALVLLVGSSGWGAVPRALGLGLWLVLLTGGLRLVAAALAGPLTATDYLEAGLSAARLLAVFLCAGVLAAAGPEGIAGLVPGRPGRRLRRRLAETFAGYQATLERGRALLHDGWRVHARRGRLTAFARRLLAAGDEAARRRAELRAAAGEPGR